MENTKKESCLSNGKFTALVILIALITAILVFTSAFLVYNLSPKVIEHAHIRETIYNFMWWSGFYIIVNGCSALVRRGWTFGTEIFKTFLPKKN